MDYSRNRIYINPEEQETIRNTRILLAVASWIVAGYCVNAMFDIVTGKNVDYFPKFYFSSLRSNGTQAGSHII